MRTLKTMAVVVVLIAAGCSTKNTPTQSPQALPPATSIPACDVAKNYKVTSPPYEVMAPGAKANEVGYQEKFDLPSDDGRTYTAWAGAVSQGGSTDADEPKTSPGCDTEFMYLELYVQPSWSGTFSFSADRLWLVTKQGIAYKSSRVSTSHLSGGQEWPNGKFSFRADQPSSYRDGSYMAYFHFYVNGWQEYARLVITDPRGQYLVERVAAHGPRYPCATGAVGPTPTDCPSS